MVELIGALGLFVGTHFLLSHPLRTPIVSKIGERAFLGVYSVVAFATLYWVVVAFRGAIDSGPLWDAGDGLWILSSVIMLVASILLVGSFFGNPAFPHPEAEGPAPQTRGVFGVTRHPMMWSFALWSLAHALVAPRPAVLALGFAIAFLALVGAAMQDRKKAALQPARWPEWTGRTSFVPYGRGWAWPGLVASIGGIVLWLAATWAHPLLGAPVAGIWRWVSA